MAAQRGEACQPNRSASLGTTGKLRRRQNLPAAVEACVPLEPETRKPTGQRHPIREVAELVRRAGF